MKFDVGVAGRNGGAVKGSGARFYSGNASCVLDARPASKFAGYAQQYSLNHEP